MASVKELHFAFDLGMDRFGTFSKENFNKAEKDWLLNEAQMIFLKRRTSPRNNRNEGFEASQKRIDDLSTLVIKYPLQPGLVPTLDSGQSERINLPPSAWHKAAWCAAAKKLPNPFFPGACTPKK